MWERAGSPPGWDRSGSRGATLEICGVAPPPPLFDDFGRTLSEELKRFASGTMRQELAELRSQVREDIRKEFNGVLRAPVKPSLSQAASASLLDLPGQPMTELSKDGVSEIGGTPVSSPRLIPDSGSDRLSIARPASMMVKTDSEPNFPSIRRLSRGYDCSGAPKIFFRSSVGSGSSRPSATSDDTAARIVESPTMSRRGVRGRLRQLRDNMSAVVGLSSLQSEFGGEFEDEELTCLDRVSGFVKSPSFDYLSGASVLLNALAVGIQTDWQARNLSHETPSGFRFLEILFCVIFSIELAFRVLAYRHEFFAKAHFKWHVFDSILVGTQLAEELTVYLVTKGVIGSSGNVGTNFSAIRVLRLLRLVRVMRLVRVLRLISELRTLVMSIMGSLKSLVWAICLLFMMMYAMGIYITQLVLDYRIDLIADTSESLALARYYGSLGDTVVSVYGAVTGGVDWADMLSPLQTEISALLVPFFMFYVAFSTLCMLNVITGVFVESALLTAKEDKDAYMVSSARSLFDTFDANRSGRMSRREFYEAVQSVEMKRVLSQLDIDVSEADVLFDLLDTDNSGRINAEDFISGCVRLRGTSKALELAILSKRASSDYRTVRKTVASIQESLRSIDRKFDSIAKGRAGSRWFDPEDV